MKQIDVDKAFLDNYFELIKNLRPEWKMDLIDKLSKTLKLDLNKNQKAFNKSFGAWESEKSANDIVMSLRESRGFYRKNDSLE